MAGGERHASLPGVLLVGEGSECFGSVFLSLDTVRPGGGCVSSRRALWQEVECGRFFLIPWGRFPINDQSKYTVTGTNGLPWSLRIEGCHPSVWMFDLLDAGPYRLEGGGISSGFILPPEVDQRRREEGVGDAAPDERSESMRGAEESGWSERGRGHSLNTSSGSCGPRRCPFWLVVDHRKTGGSTSRSRKMEREMEREILALPTLTSYLIQNQCNNVPRCTPLWDQQLINKEIDLVKILLKRLYGLKVKVL
jgi:hypothetical protein